MALLFHPFSYFSSGFSMVGRSGHGGGNEGLRNRRANLSLGQGGWKSLPEITREDEKLNVGITINLRVL